MKPTAEVAIVRVLARVVQLYSPVLVEPVLPRLLNKVLEEVSHNFPLAPPTSLTKPGRRNALGSSSSSHFYDQAWQEESSRLGYIQP